MTFAIITGVLGAVSMFVGVTLGASLANIKNMNPMLCTRAHFDSLN